MSTRSLYSFYLKVCNDRPNLYGKEQSGKRNIFLVIGKVGLLIIGGALLLSLIDDGSFYTHFKSLAYLLICSLPASVFYFFMRHRKNSIYKQYKNSQISSWKLLKSNAEQEENPNHYISFKLKKLIEKHRRFRELAIERNVFTITLIVVFLYLLVYRVPSFIAFLQLLFIQVIIGSIAYFILKVFYDFRYKQRLKQLNQLKESKLIEE